MVIGLLFRITDSFLNIQSYVVMNVANTPEQLIYYLSFYLQVATWIHEIMDAYENFIFLCLKYCFQMSRLYYGRGCMDCFRQR